MEHQRGDTVGASVTSPGNLKNSTGGRRMSGMAQTARSAVSGLNFETLAMAASKAGSQHMPCQVSPRQTEKISSVADRGKCHGNILLKHIETPNFEA